MQLDTRLESLFSMVESIKRVVVTEKVRDCVVRLMDCRQSVW